MSLLFLLMNESESRVVEKVSGLEKLTKKVRYVWLININDIYLLINKKLENNRNY